MVFAFIVGATAVVYFRLSRGAYFGSDDWRIASRGRTLDDFLEPYNGHFSIILIGLYRTLFKVFGFDTYVPWRLACLLCLLGVPVALYLAMRNRTGPLIAGIVGSYILWFPGTALSVSSLNHYLSLIGAIGCAYALARRDPASDMIVVAGLTLSLCASGGGVSAAVACIIYSLCTRANGRRWVAVLIPSGLWFVWWLAFARNVERLGGFFRLDTRGIVDATIEGARASFEGLSFANSLLGVALIVAFFVLLALRLRAGLAAAAGALAWSAALITWWAGIAYSRGAFVTPHTFRYQVVGAVYIVLALLPPTPLSLPAGWRSWRGAVALALASGAFVLVNHGGIVDQAARLTERGEATKRDLIVVNLGPGVVPDSHQYGIELGNVTGGEYRHVADVYGIPAGTKPASVDVALVELDAITVKPVRRPPQPCTAPNNTIPAPVGAQLLIHAGNAATDVGVRRFGEEFIAIGRIPMYGAARVSVRGDGSELPWIVSAPGACIMLTPAAA
ncbi:MAG: hypothetical protein ACRDV7_03830 [Acidimicrobiia bacterium]